MQMTLFLGRLQSFRLHLIQAATAASRVPTTTENLSAAEGSMKFAQNMARNILHSSLSQMETAEARVSLSNRGQKVLADELASAVIDHALREVSRHHNVEGFQSSTLSGVKMADGQAESQAFLDEVGRERPISSTDTDMNPVKELPSCKDTKPYHPPLSQSGLPVVGSLDYPDAPPTTPLLPELERSRHSFARKLKGGLAKVFLPSPPPPTPKEKESESGSTINDPQVELMEHLMHSLGTDNGARDYAEAESQPGATMEAFAEALSYDVIEWVLSSKSGRQTADDNSLHLLAQQLAETIINSSLDEAKVLI